MIKFHSLDNVYFTSDTHFNHNKILENRAYNNLDEMNNDIVKIWNNTVNHNDIVFHLGDFSFYNANHLSMLNGRKILVIGNHDNRKIKNNSSWESVRHYIEIKSDDKLLCLMHYPIENWNLKEHGSIHLHGHCHGNLSHTSKHLVNRHDVGWDVYKKPVQLSTIVGK